MRSIQLLHKASAKNTAVISRMMQVESAEINTRKVFLSASNPRKKSGRDAIKMVSEEQTAQLSGQITASMLRKLLKMEYAVFRWKLWRIDAVHNTGHGSGKFSEIGIHLIGVPADA